MKLLAGNRHKHERHRLSLSFPRRLGSLLVVLTLLHAITCASAQGKSSAMTLRPCASSTFTAHQCISIPTAPSTPQSNSTGSGSGSKSSEGGNITPKLFAIVDMQEASIEIDPGLRAISPLRWWTGRVQGVPNSIARLSTTQNTLCVVSGTILAEDEIYQVTILDQQNTLVPDGPLSDLHCRETNYRLTLHTPAQITQLQSEALAKRGSHPQDASSAASASSSPTLPAKTHVSFSTNTATTPTVAPAFDNQTRTLHPLSTCAVDHVSLDEGTSPSFLPSSAPLSSAAHGASAGLKLPSDTQRTRRAARTSPNHSVCSIYLDADLSFLDAWGGTGTLEQRKLRAMAKMIDIIFQADGIYQLPGNFPGIVSFRIVGAAVHESLELPLGSRTPSQYLDEYQRWLLAQEDARSSSQATLYPGESVNPSSVCLNHFFTHTYLGGVLGVATQADESNLILGGVCESRSAQGRALNSGMSTTSTYNHGIAAPWQTIVSTSHEIGHSLGASHTCEVHTNDNARTCSTLAGTTCNPTVAEGGPFIMSPSIAADVLGANKRFFSPCSKTSINRVLAAKGGCLTEPHPCDAYADELVQSGSNDNSTGQSPRSHCCTAQGYAPQGTGCLAEQLPDGLDEQCLILPTCSGTSDTCPSIAFAPDTTPCGLYSPETSSLVDTGMCVQGKCVHSHDELCSPLGLIGCSFKGQECLPACANTRGGVCRPFNEECRLFLQFSGYSDPIPDALDAAPFSVCPSPSSSQCTTHLAHAGVCSDTSFECECSDDATAPMPCDTSLVASTFTSSVDAAGRMCSYVLSHTTPCSQPCGHDSTQTHVYTCTCPENPISGGCILGDQLSSLVSCAKENHCQTASHEAVELLISPVIAPDKLAALLIQSLGFVVTVESATNDDDSTTTKAIISGCRSSGIGCLAASQLEQKLTTSGTSSFIRSSGYSYSVSEIKKEKYLLLAIIMGCLSAFAICFIGFAYYLHVQSKKSSDDDEEGGAEGPKQALQTDDPSLFNRRYSTYSVLSFDYSQAVPRHQQTNSSLFVAYGDGEPRDVGGNEEGDEGSSHELVVLLGGVGDDKDKGGQDQQMDKARLGAPPQQATPQPQEHKHIANQPSQEQCENAAHEHAVASLPDDTAGIPSFFKRPVAEAADFRCRRRKRVRRKRKSSRALEEALAQADAEDTDDSLRDRGQHHSEDARVFCESIEPIVQRRSSRIKKKRRSRHSSRRKFAIQSKEGAQPVDGDKSLLDSNGSVAEKKISNDMLQDGALDEIKKRTLPSISAHLFSTNTRTSKPAPVRTTTNSLARLLASAEVSASTSTPKRGVHGPDTGQSLAQADKGNGKGAVRQPGETSQPLSGDSVEHDARFTKSHGEPARSVPHQYFDPSLQRKGPNISANRNKYVRVRPFYFQTNRSDNRLAASEASAPLRDVRGEGVGGARDHGHDGHLAASEPGARLHHYAHARLPLSSAQGLLVPSSNHNQQLLPTVSRNSPDPRASELPQEPSQHPHNLTAQQTYHPVGRPFALPKHLQGGVSRSRTISNHGQAYHRSPASHPSQPLWYSRSLRQPNERPLGLDGPMTASYGEPLGRQAPASFMQRHPAPHYSGIDFLRVGKPMLATPREYRVAASHSSEQVEGDGYFEDSLFNIDRASSMRRPHQSPTSSSMKEHSKSRRHRSSSPLLDYNDLVRDVQPSGPTVNSFAQHDVRGYADGSFHGRFQPDDHLQSAVAARAFLHPRVASLKAESSKRARTSRKMPVYQPV